MTRRQFAKESSAMKTELSAVNDKINSILFVGDLHPDFHQLNDLHDQADDIERLIESLETAYERQSWSHQNWVIHSLIMNNID